jgi:hypothetical protein
MFQNFSRWLRSKTGMATVAIVVVLAIVAAFAGQQLGWWGGAGAAGVPPDPGTCGLVATNYNVENPATVPFYSVKYTFASGQVVKSGAADNFTYVIPAATAQSITALRISAKANPYVGEVKLDGCNFAGPDACNVPKADTAGRFKFQFVGAQDNGDGTLTLKFYVQVITTRALTYVAIELPSGVVPSSPTGTYSGQTCPTP